MLQYHITDETDLHHLHHVVHMCEKRLRVLDAADARNPDPSNEFGFDHVPEPSAEEYDEYHRKKVFIQEERQKAVMKLNSALAQLRRATHPDLLRDEIFQNFDVDKAWALRKTPPPQNSTAGFAALNAVTSASGTAPRHSASSTPCGTVEIVRGERPAPTRACCTSSL